MTTKTKDKFLTFGKPDIGEEEMSAVMDVMRSGWLGTGKVANELEREFEKFMGGGYAVAVSSGTMGLVISLKAMGIARGEKVLTTPLTFCATVNAILEIGATPVFSDVNEDGVMDRGKAVIWSEDVSAILPVNYTGLTADMKAEWFKIPVIEDAAHSFGGTCGYGTASVFSLYPTKNITSGEGGIVWTRHKLLADRCRVISNHGQSNGAWSRYSSGPIDNYQVLHPGYKGTMPDILAAIGLTQLKRWHELKIKREKIWKIYEGAFGKRKSGHSQHLFTVKVKDRAKVREELYNRGIGTGIHYEPLHLEPAYKFLGYREGDFPMAERIGKQTLSLPISTDMNIDDALRVIQAVKEVTGDEVFS